MDFTFGIITDGNNYNNLVNIVNRIHSFQILNYQIIVVGNLNPIYGVEIIPFNENIKPAWITRKKNIITENAKYENIVYSHDYLCPEPNWYDEFLKHGNDFSICVNRIINPNGSRYRDWTIDAMARISHIVKNNLERLLPYDETSLSKIMYISGAHWVAKKEVMKKFPLDERFSWGQAEDVEWSYRVRQELDFSINHHSVVRLLKEKNPSFIEVSPQSLKKFRGMSNKELSIILDYEKEYYNRDFK